VKNTSVRAEREGDVVVLAGTLNGRTINKRFKKNGLPWYQLFEVSGIAIVLSEKQKTRFFCIRPDVMESIDMEAMREHIQTIPVNGIPIRTIQLKITPAGFASIFWNVRLWFSMDAAAPATVPQGSSGCPGMREMTPTHASLPRQAPGSHQTIPAESQLGNWPIQLHLLSPMAPQLAGKDVLLSADCVAHAVPNLALPEFMWMRKHNFSGS
jgi:hypothetical protein